MFIPNNSHRALYKAISLAVVSLFLINDLVFGIPAPSSDLNRAALAPPLATKYQSAFHDKWAFGDVAVLIGQMLVLTKEHKLQNPKDILIPLIKKHIRDRGGEGEILLEGYDITV